MFFFFVFPYRNKIQDKLLPNELANLRWYARLIMAQVLRSEVRVGERLWLEDGYVKIEDAV